MMRCDRSDDTVGGIHFIADKAISLLKQDTRINAIYLIGSLARDEADRFSDVDLCIAVDDGRIEEVIRDSHEMAAAVAKIVLSHWYVAKQWHCVLYEYNDVLVKVDFEYYVLSRMPDLVRRSLDTRTYLYHRIVAHDPHAVTDRVFGTACTQEPSGYRLNASCFLLDAFNATRMARRGELFEAIDIMNRMRDPELLHLLCDLYGVPFENYRRLETKLPADVVGRLARTMAMPTIEGVLVALKELLSLYRHTRSSAGVALTQEEQQVLDHILLQVEESSNG